MIDKFTVIENAVSKETINLAAGYFIRKFNFIKDFSLEEGNINGDVVEPYSIFYYNDPLSYSFLFLLKDLVEEASGKNLLITYCFTRMYRKPMWMRAHKDREACEFSVTMPITGEAWPIFIEGNPVSITPGDIIIYKGREVKHWREPLEGPDQVQLHLHYVDADGPCKDHVNDSCRT